MKIDILAVGIHPDDVELSCAGTLLKHIAAGKTVGILDLTKGEMGTRGTPELRKQEAENAAKILGVKFREIMDLRDGLFKADEAEMMEIIKRIRKYRPEIVLCNAIEDRHPDHGRAAKLVADACFYSGLRRIETTFGDKKQEAWRPKAVYHYIQDRHIIPDFVVDVTPFVEKKMDAIKAFSSQFYDPDSKEPLTPIAGESFLEFVKARMRVMGRDINVDFAEGFTASRMIGVDDLFGLR